LTAQDLTQQETHFAFGRNWADYAAKIGDAEIAEADRGLARLLAGERLEGRRFLDIGSGSGLHSLAALRLGARDVVAVDIDPDSVATTRAVLGRFAVGRVWKAEQVSVFDLDPERYGTFDVVYSWGVLHHTGDMERAMRRAAQMVRPGGQFVFALYRRIWMDGFWRWEKRWYTKASAEAQRRARAVYGFLFRIGLRLTGRRFDEYVGTYRGNRGMDFWNDVHDWMGGWPYESISPAEIDSLMRSLGFARVRAFVTRGHVLARHSGVFGSGCDEFVYTRAAVPA
jgi:2-polyprenyl-6-hydroxyphenyl methylase/3-demethylubiquinone-9 3-methyltransferase